MQEVRVEAQRPLLQKDATSTTRFISGSDMRQAPGPRLQGRGGPAGGDRELRPEHRPGVEQWSDPDPARRASQRDRVLRGRLLAAGSADRKLHAAINNNAIDEVVVLNGGFNAEYGRIMSGVVNVVTKEGGSRYSGSLDAVTDNITGTGDKLLNSRVYDYNIYDGAFGGPLAPGKEWGSFIRQRPSAAGSGTARRV